LGKPRENPQLGAAGPPKREGSPPPRPPSPKEHFRIHWMRLAIPGFRGGISGRLSRRAKRMATRGRLAPATGPAACDRRIPARLSRRGAKRSPAPRCRLDFSRQWHFLWLPQAASERRCVPEFMTETAARFRAGLPASMNPLIAKETLTAKMAGRWSDGVRLARAPTARMAEIQCPIPPRSRPDKNFAGYVARVKGSHRLHVQRTIRQGLQVPDHLPHAGGSIPATGWHRPAPRVSVLNNRRPNPQAWLPYGDSSRGCPTRTSTASHADRLHEPVSAVPSSCNSMDQLRLDANAGNDTCPLTAITTSERTGAKGQVRDCVRS